MSSSAALAAWVDECQTAFASASPTASRGESSLTYAALNSLRQLLDLDLSRLLDDNRVALCFKDSPLSYITEKADFLEGVQRATIVVQTLESYSEFFASICHAFLVGTAYERAHISCYISQVTSDRFGLHVDDWDAVLLQLAGEKDFAFPGLATLRLLPGDWCVIGRGVSHMASQTGQSQVGSPSLHLSVSLHER